MRVIYHLRFAVRWTHLLPGLSTMLLLLASAAGAADPQTSLPAGKLTLAQCIEIAMNRNSQVLIAQRQVESAEATAFSSWSGIMPQINASILNSNRSISGDRIFQQNVPVGLNPDGSVRYDRRVSVQQGNSLSSFSSGVSLSQPIYDGGRWWYNIKQARQSVQVSSLNVDTTERTVALNVKQQCYTLLKAIRLQQVLEEQVKLTEEQLKRSESMYEIGSVAKIDVLQARAALGNAKIDRLRQEQAVLQARAALNTVLGMDVNAPIDVVDDVSVETADLPPPISLEQAMQDALRDNPDIKRSSGNVDVVKLSTKIARSALLPRVTGLLSYGRNGSELGKVYGDFSKNWTVGLGLNMSLNLLNGTQTYADIDRTQADLLAAEENLELTRRNTMLDIKQAVLSLETTRQVVALSEENIRASEESVRLAQERYKVGSGTLLEVFNAQVNLTRAKSSLVNAQYDYKIAQAQLDKAMGRPVK